MVSAVTVSPRSALPPTATGLLRRGILHQANTEAFVRLASEDQHAYCRVLGEWRLSLQTQRELLDWLPAIASAEHTSVGAILEGPAVGACLNGDNRPQAIARLRDTVFRRRFPSLAGVKARWDEQVRRTNPDPRTVQFTAPPAFERDGVEVRVRVRDADHARRVFGALAEAPEDAWKMLVRPLDTWRPQSGAEDGVRGDY